MRKTFEPIERALEAADCPMTLTQKVLSRARFKGDREQRHCFELAR